MNFFTVYGPLPDYKLQKIMKLLPRICCVCVFDAYRYSCPNRCSADEALLRKRIQELQQYRRLGLSTPADIEKYETDLAKRVSGFPLHYCPGCTDDFLRHKSKLLLRGIMPPNDFVPPAVNHLDQMREDPAFLMMTTINPGNLPQDWAPHQARVHRQWPAVPVSRSFEDIAQSLMLFYF